VEIEAPNTYFDQTDHVLGCFRDLRPSNRFIMSIFVPNMSEDESVPDPALLIQAVRDNPCLWNQSDRQYKDAERNNRIWDEVATHAHYESEYFLRCLLLICSTFRRICCAKSVEKSSRFEQQPPEEAAGREQKRSGREHSESSSVLQRSTVLFECLQASSRVSFLLLFPLFHSFRSTSLLTRRLSLESQPNGPDLDQIISSTFPLPIDESIAVFQHKMRSTARYGATTSICGNSTRILMSRFLQPLTSERSKTRPSVVHAEETGRF
jgi:hypothetical protein